MDFCNNFLVNGKPLQSQIIDLLYWDLLNTPSNGCLEEWYELMTNNVNGSNMQWKSITPKHGVINIDNLKKDVLFECDQTLFTFSSINPLFAYPRLGHDVPVLLSCHDEYSAGDCLGHNTQLEDILKAKRVMIVSQDPLRNRGKAGKILFSSPFGVHCHDYRNKPTEDMMKILQGLWYKLNKEKHIKDVVFYLTDFNKLYIQDKTSIKTLNKHYPNIVNSFKSILDAEIDLFKPDLIVTLGNYASENLLGTFKATNRFKTQVYNGIDVLPMYHIAYVRSYGAKKVSSKYTSWIDWYIDEIFKCI